MNIEESKINLKNLICEYKRTIQLYGDFFIGLQEIQAIETLLTAYEKEKEKNKALKEGLKYRINYCKLLEKELYANGVNYEFEKTEIEKQFLEKE